MSLSTRIVEAVPATIRAPFSPPPARLPRTDLGSAFGAFWVGFPAALGLFSGWNQIGMIAPALPLEWSIIYWLLLAMIMWLGLGLGTLIASAGLRRLPYPALLILGAVLGVALTRPAHALFQKMFVPLTAPVQAVLTLPAIPSTAAQWLQLYQGNLLLMLFWIGGALFFGHFIGYRPLGAASPAPVFARVPVIRQTDHGAPRFAARLTKLPFDSIDTVLAEDHYVRCFGEQGKEMLLYRFTDVVDELASHGWIRVHRSACIRQDRVIDVAHNARRMSVTMLSGCEVVISARYQALAQTGISAFRDR